MAVLTHLVGGIDYIQIDPDTIATEILIGESYTNFNQSGTATTTYTDGISGTVDTSVFGTYTVLYTAQDDGSGDHTVTEIVTIIAQGNIDTNFDTGSVLRDGTDVSGTTYESTVQAGITSDIKATQAAYFDALACDPYEVKHSK
ncbi:MAG: hypothetical protein J7L15_06150 [Clostridiales bacterium]|nr:hypothetical protein [Clostridiales bacterium]